MDVVIIQSLHDHGVLTSPVTYKHADWPLNNATPFEALDVILTTPPSSSSGSLLVLGHCDLALQLFRKLFTVFNNTSPAMSIVSGGPLQWLALVDVRDRAVLGDVLTKWESVAIDVSSSPLPVRTLVQSQTGTRSPSLMQQRSETLPLSPSRLLPNPSTGLGGCTLRVVVRQRYMMVKKVMKGDHQGFEGALIDILRELSARLNFTYHLIESSEDSWGQELDNGQWDGLIGYLTRQEADLALGSLRVTRTRADVADYTLPFAFYDAVLAFKTTDTNTSHSNDDFFLRPLQVEVYAVLLGCLLWVLVLLVLSRACHRFTQGQQAGAAEIINWLSTDAQNVVAAMLNRCHVLLITWVYVSVVVVGYTYSSQLTASLTVQEVSPPFSSLQQLVSQDTYTWGMANGTALQSLIQASPDKIYQQFWEGVSRFSQTQPTVLSSDDETQLSQVMAGRYAFLLGSQFVVTYWQSLHCDLAGVIVKGFQKPAALFLQKNSPYTSMVSEQLSRMRESGVVQRILLKWMPEKRRCRPSAVKSAIALKQTRAAFYLLLIGMCASLLILALEVFCFVRR